jgi:predicted ArsR family transcriptional regulator
MGVRELAKAIGRRVTTIYHHIQVLEEVGLIEVDSVEPSAGGRPYTIYKARAPRIRLARAAADPKLKRPYAKWVRMIGNEAARQHINALDHEHFVKGARRNMWIFRIVCSPSEKRLARINELLDELAELAWTPDPNPGPLLSIGWFVSPLGRPTRKPRSPRKK